MGAGSFTIDYSIVGLNTALCYSIFGAGQSGVVMPSVILATAPIHGHVNAYLPIARHLVTRGDDVRFLTGSRFAGPVAATGARHVPLPAVSDFDDREDMNSRFPERAELRGARAIGFDVEHYFVLPGRGQYEVLTAELASDPADVVVADPVFIGAAYLLSLPAPRRPAVLVGSHLPLPLASRDTAPYGMGLAPAPVLNRLRNRVLGALASGVMKGANSVAETDHLAIFGRPLPTPVMDWLARADAIAQFTVAEFEYPRSDAPPALHFVGPIHGPGQRFDAPTWWDELDGSRPVVHVTQGTIANKDFSQLVTPTVEALADEDLLVVVSAGGRPVDTLPPLPSNARAASYLDYDQLLPKTDVFVTNGGYGGVQTALRHGLPVVVTGGKEDKPEVGARIAWSGTGIRCKQERPSPDSLRRAIRRILADDRYRTSAQQLARRMTDAPGLTGLSTLIDDLSIPATA